MCERTSHTKWKERGETMNGKSAIWTELAKSGISTENKDERGKE